VTGQQDRDLDRAAVDQAAAAAVQQVAASYMVELAGRPLNVHQRELLRRAEALARHWQREARKEGRP
jgi:uncharacterized membrane protein